jgi:hypothetical protein
MVVSAVIPQQRQKNLSPVFEGAIDASNFQTVICVEDLQLLIMSADGQNQPGRVE